MRRNSGLTGLLKSITQSNASGKHDTFDQFNSRYADAWPPGQLNFTAATSGGAYTYNRNQIVTITYSGNLNYNRIVYIKLNTVSGNFSDTDLDTTYIQRKYFSKNYGVGANSFSLRFKPNNTSQGATVFNVSFHLDSWDNPAIYTTNNITINDQSLSVSVPASTNQDTSMTMTFTTVGATNGDTIYWYLDSNWSPSSGTATVSNNSATATSTPVPTYYSTSGTTSTSATAYLGSTSTSGTAKSFTPVINKKFIIPYVWIQVNGGSTYSYSASNLSVNEGDTIRVYLGDSTGAAPATGSIYNNQVGLTVTTTGFSTSDVTQGTLTGTLSSANSYSTTFNITNDNAIDGVEYVRWNITSAYDSSTIGSGSRQLAVQDTSVPPSVTAWYPLFEGQSYSYYNPAIGTTISTTESGSFDIKAIFSTSTNASFDWSIQHITTVAADFTTTSGTATASSGTLTITINPVADATTEYDQTFKITIVSNGTGAAVVNGTSTAIRLKDTSKGVAAFMDVSAQTGSKYTTSGDWGTSLNDDQQLYMYYHPTYYSNTPVVFSSYRNDYYHDYYYTNGSSLAWNQNAFYSSNFYGWMFNFSRDGLYGVQWNGSYLYVTSYNSNAYPTNFYNYSSSYNNYSAYPYYTADRIAKPHFSADGTKVYLTYYDASNYRWCTDTWSLGTAFNVNSATRIHTWTRSFPSSNTSWPDSNASSGYNRSWNNYEKGNIEFNNTGTYVVTHHPTDRWSFKFYKLTTAWDLSTAVEVGDKSMLSAFSTNTSPGGQSWLNQYNSTSGTDPTPYIYSGIKCFTISPDGLQLWIQLIDNSGYSSGTRYTYKFDIPAEYVVPKLYIGKGQLANVSTSSSIYWTPYKSNNTLYGPPQAVPPIATTDNAFVYSSGTYSLTNSNTNGAIINASNSNDKTTLTTFSPDGTHAIRWNNNGYNLQTWSCPTAYSMTNATLISSVSYTGNDQNVWNAQGQSISYPTILYAYINNTGNRVLLMVRAAQYSGSSTATYWIGTMMLNSSPWTFQQNLGNNYAFWAMCSEYNATTFSQSYFLLSPNAKRIILWDGNGTTNTTLRENTLQGEYFVAQGANYYNAGTTKNIGSRTWQSSNTIPLWNIDGSRFYVEETYNQNYQHALRYYPVTLTELPYPTALSDSVYMVPTSNSSTTQSMTIEFNSSYNAATKLAESMTAYTSYFVYNGSGYFISAEIVTAPFTTKGLYSCMTTTANSAYNVTISDSIQSVYTTESETTTQPYSLIISIYRNSYNTLYNPASPMSYQDGTESKISLVNGVMKVKCQDTTAAAKLTAFMRSLIKIGDAASSCSFIATSPNASPGLYDTVNITDITRNDVYVEITGTTTYTAGTYDRETIYFKAQYGETYSYVAPPVPMNYMTAVAIDYNPNYGQYYIQYNSSETYNKLITILSETYYNNTMRGSPNWWEGEPMPPSNYQLFYQVFNNSAYSISLSGSPYNQWSGGQSPSKWIDGFAPLSSGPMISTSFNTAYFTLYVNNNYSIMKSIIQTGPNTLRINLDYWNLNSTIFAMAATWKENCAEFTYVDMSNLYITRLTNITDAVQTVSSPSNCYLTITGTITPIADNNSYGYETWSRFAYKWPIPVAGAAYNIAAPNWPNMPAYQSSYVDIYFYNSGDAVAFWNSLQTPSQPTIKISDHVQGFVATVQIYAPPNPSYYSSSGGPTGSGYMRLNFYGPLNTTGPYTSPPSTIQKL